MKRPLAFALELLAALALATAGAWLADKVGRKINAKSNADVRSSYALQVLVDVERERLEVEKKFLASSAVRAPLAGAWCSTGELGTHVVYGQMRETCQRDGLVFAMIDGKWNRIQ